MVRRGTISNHPWIPLVAAVGDPAVVHQRCKCGCLANCWTNIRRGHGNPMGINPTVIDARSWLKSKFPVTECFTGALDPHFDLLLMTLPPQGMALAVKRIRKLYSKGPHPGASKMPINLYSCLVHHLSISIPFLVEIGGSFPL